MSENNVIKSIVVHVCPHCKGEIFIESQMTPPIVNSVFTTKDIESAKADCLARIESLSIDEEKKTSVIRWLNDPNTIFGPGEVETIILSLLKPDNE